MNSLLPKAVFIQTQTGCNSNCVMCPNAQIMKEKPFLRMEEWVYKKIIDELSLLNYKGQIGLYLMFEPLLDKTIFEKINYAKEKCPLSTIVISTNASVLKKEITEELINSKIDIIYFNVNGMTKKHMKELCED